MQISSFSLKMLEFSFLFFFLLVDIILAPLSPLLCEFFQSDLSDVMLTDGSDLFLFY